MLIYVVLFFISCILTLTLTPPLRRLAEKKNALDYPDYDDRKIHKEAVPRIGGVVIAISFFITTAISYILYKPEKAALTLIGLFIGSSIILAWGLWDDLHKMKAKKKSLGQLMSVLALLPFGFFIRGFSIPFVQDFVEIVWWLGIPLTFFWIVGIINTINFIDGMDGLAAGVTAIIAFALFVISAVTGQKFMAIISLILAGSVIGFLKYNFHPASIFMGDCGAMFLGFVLAVISVETLFHNRSITASSIVPVLIFGLPIVDSSWAIIRRLMKGQSPFHADGLHTHHRLMNLGFSQRRVVLILYLASLPSVAGGVFLALAGNDIMAVVIPISMLIIASSGVALLVTSGK